MKKFFLIMLAGLGFHVALKAQTRDSIYLYNGQLLIGTVKSASLGSVTIDEMDLKILNIKMYKIRRLRVNTIFKIETINKKIYTSSINSTNKDGWVDVIAGLDQSVSIPIVAINIMVSLDKNFFKSLSGSVAAGLSYTKSSNIGQLNLSGNIAYARGRFEHQLTMSELASIDSSRLSRDNENLQLFTLYEINYSWYVAGIIQYQRNLELSIARRYIGMIGGGNKLVVKNDWQLYATTGINFSQERSTEGESSGLLLEIPVIFKFNFYKFQHPNIQIASSQTAYFSLSQAGRIRYDGSTNFSWELIRYFYLTLSPYTNFDSRPPTGGIDRFDFGIVFSVSYKF